MTDDAARPLTDEEIAGLRFPSKNWTELTAWDAARLLATIDARPSGDEALRERLLDLQDWLIHPDRAYSPHEIAMYAHDRIAAALGAAALAAPVSPSPDVAVIRAQRRSHRRADMEAKVAAILFGAVDDETFDRVIAVLREEPHA